MILSASSAQQSFFVSCILQGSSKRRFYLMGTNGLHISSYASLSGRRGNRLMLSLKKCLDRKTFCQASEAITVHPAGMERSF